VGRGVIGCCDSRVVIRRSRVRLLSVLGVVSWLHFIRIGARALATRTPRIAASTSSAPEYEAEYIAGETFTHGLLRVVVLTLDDGVVVVTVDTEGTRGQVDEVVQRSVSLDLKLVPYTWWMA
jgi:hypothetical protein